MNIMLNKIFKGLRGHHAKHVIFPSGDNMENYVSYHNDICRYSKCVSHFFLQENPTILKLAVFLIFCSDFRYMSGFH